MTPQHPWKRAAPIGITDAEANRHAIVIGPTRGGKTTGVIAPWIVSALAQGYAVATVDVKGNGDLLAEVVRYRDANFPGSRFGLTSVDFKDVAKSRAWNFFAELDNDGAIDAAAAAICGLPRDNDPNRQFHLRDLKWMRGLLETIHASSLTWTVRDLIELLALPDGLSRLMAYATPRSASRLSDLAAMNHADRAQATQFLSVYLEALNHDGLNQICAGSSHPVTMAHAAVNSSNLLLINAPQADGSISEVVSGLALSLVVNSRLRQFNSAVPPLLLVIDEAAALKDRIDLNRIVSLVAGANVSVLLALQDVSQLEESLRDSVLANCGTVILLSGSHASSAEYVAKMLGTRERRVDSTQTTHSKTGSSTTRGTTTTTVPVLGVNELRSPYAGAYGATIVNRRLSSKPVVVDLARIDLTQPHPSP